ncbi:MAG: ribonuclease III [Clostridia bacterium]|nr:ribonuclease III [Clostridia bacterium]
MPRGADKTKLEQALGYQFANADLLEQALTHSSYANESRAKHQDCESNERLEFLGDAVLQIYISEHLYRTYPRCAEGELTKMRQYLVCEGTLAKISTSISLGDYLHLGKGEEQNGGRQRPSILADAFESLLAAIYLDSRAIGKHCTREILYELMKEEISLAATAHIDYKTKLQQFIQQDGIEELSYVTVEESGPAHDRLFRVEARINSNTVGVGEGKTKREAEQKAAYQALALFGLADE